MEPILKKSEIGELLQALRDGKISLELEDGEQEKFLDCTPINLFQLARPGRDELRIPNLDIIIDNFCRAYATSLTNQLQRTFSITRKSLESYEFQKFMTEKAKQGAIGILDLPPLKYGALIIFDPNLSFSMVEIMLGASAEIESVHLDRMLTTIELNVLKTVISEACRDIDKAFKQLLTLETTLMKLENNARLVSIVEPEAEVIVGTLQLKVGDYSGEINLVFPYVTLEPLRELLKDLLAIATKTKSNWPKLISDELQLTPLTVSAQTGVIGVTIGDLLHLQPGDILGLSYDPKAPVKVMVERKHKFNAIPGTHNGNKAISLTEVID